jgi:hypothetical protein
VEEALRSKWSDHPALVAHGAEYCLTHVQGRWLQGFQEAIRVPD